MPQHFTFPASTTSYCSKPKTKYDFFMNDYFQLFNKKFPQKDKKLVIASGLKVWRSVENKDKLLNVVGTHNLKYFAVLDGQLVLSTSGVEYCSTVDEVSQTTSSYESTIQNINADLMLLTRSIIDSNSQSLTEVLRAEKAKLMEKKFQHCKKYLSNAKHALAQQRYRERVKKGQIIVKEGVNRRKVPSLSRIIESIVENSAADERRRTNVVVAKMGIKEIHKRVNELLDKEGTSVSETTIRRAMKPKRKNSQVAKKHYDDAVVKLQKAVNNLSESHPDGHYSLALMKYVRSFCHSIKDEVKVLSIDKKKNIDLYGPTTSRSYLLAQTDKTGPTLTNDHTFPCPNQASIGPNVVLECVIEANLFNEVVIKQGQKFLTMRSNWTNPLTKLENLIDLKFAFDQLGNTTPVLVVLCDGHNVGAPCNRFNQLLYYLLMKEYDLDALIVTTHAPGYSKYNPVEHIMSNISFAIKGLNNILSKEEVDNRNKKKKEFLSKVDSVMKDLTFIIENECKNMNVRSITPGEDEYLFSGDCREDVPEADDIQAYFDKKLAKKGRSDELENIEDLIRKVHKHSCLGNGAYCLSMRKCSDPSCCLPRRSTHYWEVLKDFDGYIPHPILKENSEHYISWKDRLQVPGVGVDDYRPNTKKESSICKKGCGRVLHSVVEAVEHYKLCHSKNADISWQVITVPIEERNGYRVPKTSINGRSQQHQYDEIVDGNFSSPRRQPKDTMELTPVSK